MPTIKSLTIAILTYKRPLELKRCLKSIYQQSHQPHKILIIDSFHLQKNIPECRNLAIKKCKTKYLAFIDDDCILYKDWVINAYHSISTDKKLSYVVGKTRLLNKDNYLAVVQFNNYLQWFNKTHSLDTKNLILNLQLIKPTKFDPNFKIFEDVDFSQQLKSKHLKGKFNPNMVVFHSELTSFFGAVKKNFIRGQYKAAITKKWGEYDHYSPTIPQCQGLIDFVFKLSFLLGYLKNRPRPITIVNCQDNGANSKRLSTISRFLTDKNYFVLTIDSHTEFQKVIASRRFILTYGLPLIKYRILKNIYEYLKLDIGPRLLIETMALKAKIIDNLLRSNRSYLVIIQNPEDMSVCSIKRRPYQILYDSPTIYYRELELNSKYSKSIVKKLKYHESKAYLNSDFVSFHWYTYFDIARKYNLKINNPLVLNWGCESINKFAKYNQKSKTIHLGKLNSYWVNPHLLAAISKKIKIDIFSYEKPDTFFYHKLPNFKGYLPNEDSTSKYQFGLITISRDDLRSSGFSAKYLLYLSYGLPVLCPEWRYDPLLSSATIYYNETNIEQVLVKYQNSVLWHKKHLAALKLSKKLNWNNTLKNLLKITNEKNR